jgi:hypothetical protein
LCRACLLGAPQSPRDAVAQDRTLQFALHRTHFHRPTHEKNRLTHCLKAYGRRRRSANSTETRRMKLQYVWLRSIPALP